jgi:hypothetical protein
MYVCKHVCPCVSMFVSMYVCNYICIIYLNMYMYVCVYVCIYVGVNVKFFLCLTNHTMLTYRELEVRLHAFLTSALWGAWWPWRPGCFAPRKAVSGAYQTGCWVAPEPLWTQLCRTGISCLIKSRPSSPWPDHYTDWAFMTLNRSTAAIRAKHQLLGQRWATHERPNGL